MPKRYRFRFPRAIPSALAALALLAAAAPARAALEFDQSRLRFFAGLPITFLVHGPLADKRILSVGEVSLEPTWNDGLRVELTFRTEAYPGLVDQFAAPIHLPRVPAGNIELVVLGIDSSGFRTRYIDQEIAAAPPLDVALDETELAAGESFTVRARFLAPGGSFRGTWQLVGDTLRVPIYIGCHACPISGPSRFFDLTSAPVGPLAAGEYTVELTDPDGYEFPYFRQKIRVLPADARLQGGRFTVEIPLDPPHGGLARLAEPPSADSALFYFFSPDNWEVMVKVLDGCELNGKFWVFGAASTDVGYTVVVRDNLGGTERRYRHAAGSPAPAITDTAAFDCAAPAAGAGR